MAKKKGHDYTDEWKRLETCVNYKDQLERRENPRLKQFLHENAPSIEKLKTNFLDAEQVCVFMNIINLVEESHDEKLLDLNLKLFKKYIDERIQDPYYQ